MEEKCPAQYNVHGCLEPEKHVNQNFMLVLRIEAYLSRPGLRWR